MENTNDFSMEKFSPAKAEVLKVVEQSKKTDISNIEQVHENRMALRDVRIDITKRAKELREGALQFQKDVISREKELVALVTPEEDRLEAIEAEAKLKKQMEARRAELPTRLAALESIGDGYAAAETEILKMDDNEFNSYRLMRIEAKLEKDRLEMERKRQEDEHAARQKAAAEDQTRREKIQAEEMKLAEERRAIEVEKARLAGIEEQRLKEEAAKKAEIERQEREAKLVAEKKAAEEKRIMDENTKRVREAEFVKYLETIGYNKDTDLVKPLPDGSTQVWRLLATYKPSK